MLSESGIPKVPLLATRTQRDVAVEALADRTLFTPAVVTCWVVEFRYLLLV